MEENKFREDLYYRLNLFHIEIPPLRERRADIPLLAGSFLDRLAAKRKKSLRGFSDEAQYLLLHYAYPGNVRELENAIEYAVAFSRDTEITQNDMPATFRGAPPPTVHLKPLKAARLEFERGLVAAALQECGGNVSRTARLLDIHRQSLQQKIKELGISTDDLKDG